MNERDRPAASEAEPNVGELVEGVVRKLVTAIVIAGGLVALGLWSSRPSSPGHYQVIAADGRIYRVNTQSGTVIGCEGNRCAIIVQHGQELEDSLPAMPAVPRLAPQPQAVPAPAPAVAPPAAAR